MRTKCHSLSKEMNAKQRPIVLFNTSLPNTLQFDRLLEKNSSMFSVYPQSLSLHYLHPITPSIGALSGCHCTCIKSFQMILATTNALSSYPIFQCFFNSSISTFSFLLHSFLKTSFSSPNTLTHEACVVVQLSFINLWSASCVYPAITYIGKPILHLSLIL